MVEKAETTLKKKLKKYKLEKKLDLSKLKDEIYKAEINDNNRLFVQVLSVFADKDIDSEESMEIAEAYNIL